MSKTELSNLINPEVMADMISADLPKKIKFSPLAMVDNTLVGQAGNTITVPSYSYIGDAEDVAEGIAMGTTVLTASTTQATVKKAGKAVELTDEAVLSGYGDPVGEATNQLALSISAKVDNDCVTALETASLEYDDSDNSISYDGIVDAVDKFEEEDDVPKVLIIHPKQKTTLRKDSNFIRATELGDRILMTGIIGEIAGCQVYASSKVPETSDVYTAFIVKYPVEGEKQPALSIYMKRDIDIEQDRDVLAKTTVISADEHYTVALSNDAKVVKYKSKA